MMMMMMMMICRILASLSSFSPTEGITTLTQWWGLCDQMMLRAKVAVA
jgi:hypothetical protein